jgi:hypothetical protein
MASLSTVAPNTAAAHSSFSSPDCGPIYIEARRNQSGTNWNKRVRRVRLFSAVNQRSNHKPDYRGDQESAPSKRARNEHRQWPNGLVFHGPDVNRMQDPPRKAQPGNCPRDSAVSGVGLSRAWCWLWRSWCWHTEAVPANWSGGRVNHFTDGPDFCRQNVSRGLAVEV